MTTLYGDSTNWDTTDLTKVDLPDYVGDTDNDDATTPEAWKAGCSVEDFQPPVRSLNSISSSIYLNTVNNSINPKT